MVYIFSIKAAMQNNQRRFDDFVYTFKRYMYANRKYTHQKRWKMYKKN